MSISKWLTTRTARVSIEGRQHQYLIGPRGLWSAATPEPISNTPEVRLRIIVIDAPGNRFLEDSLWFSVSALYRMLTMQVLDLLSDFPRPNFCTRISTVWWKSFDSFRDGNLRAKRPSTRCGASASSDATAK